MRVEVTQYMQPNGQRRAESTYIADDLETHYNLMLARGWNFSAEVLTTGMVSVCIEDRPGEQDINQRLVQNGPGVQQALADMLRESCSEPMPQVAENADKPPMHVRHSDLVSASANSMYRKECPVCKIGTLLVGRDSEGKLKAEDRCVLCAQQVIYDDIDDMRTTLG